MLKKYISHSQHVELVQSKLKKMHDIYKTTGNVNPDWIFYNIKELMLIFF